LNQTIVDLSRVVRDRNGVPLVCSGCAHSAAFAKFPGCPSGERPCCFCTRNPDREALKADAYSARPEMEGKRFDPWSGKWYDGSQAKKCPQDNYHSVDMKFQAHDWVAAAGGGKTA